MKRTIALVAALAVSITLAGAAIPARAELNCVEKILDPVIQLPVTVCVDLPLVPAIPPLPPVLSGPIVVPPLAPPAVPPVPSVPTNPVSPSTPVQPGEAPAAPSIEQPVPAVPEAVEPAPGEQFRVQEPAHPTPAERAESDVQEKIFPFTVFVVLLLVILVGVYVFGLIRGPRAKTLDKL